MAATRERQPEREQQSTTHAPSLTRSRSGDKRPGRAGSLVRGAFRVISAMPEPLIALRNVEKAFRHGVSRTYVLRRITLDIAAGEFVSVMGPSGAGKSTLLHILGMHDAEWSGEYDLLGQPVHALRPKHRQALGRKHVGFVFQSYHLLDDLTVAENLEVPLSYRDVPRSERQSLVAGHPRPVPDRRQEGPLPEASSPGGSSSSSALRER